jgi:hypothetical protein
MAKSRRTEALIERSICGVLSQGLPVREVVVSVDGSIRILVGPPESGLPSRPANKGRSCDELFQAASDSST